MNNQLMLILEEEMNRRKTEKNTSVHPTQIMLIRDKEIEIDQDMVLVVAWMTSLSIETLFCCQGDTDVSQNGKHKKKPYITWKCHHLLTVRYIISVFTEFHIHSAIPNGEGHIRHMFHEVSTKVDFMDGNLRYYSEWYDNLALRDFNKYLQKHEGIYLHG